jgi:fructuronate reductase
MAGIVGTSTTSYPTNLGRLNAVTPLSRDTPAAPVRIVHLGLGSFFRAHQAWYTAAAPDAGRWGIAAFTGRSARLADELSAQDGLYTLIVRGADRDDFTVLGAVSAAYPGTDVETFCVLLSRPEVAVVTLTVTEAGYPRGRDGELAVDDPVVRTDGQIVQGTATGDVHSVPGRLVAGLAARKAAGAGGLAIVCCDNLPDNGAMTERLVTGLAELADPALAGWIRANVSFVTTMVDRITPATTADDIATVAAATGRADTVPVVTEPFTEWVLQGDFPAGRPRWEDAGARFVDDVAPHEQRKLWLLNGGHSLLAYAASALGHSTVAEAVADGRCRQWLAEWWDEAAARLPLPAAEVADYRAALLDRWANPRIRHMLAQIATDGSQKIAVRILPVLRLGRAGGELPPGAIRVLAAWVEHLRGAGAPVKDAAADTFVAAAAGTAEQAARAVLGLLDGALGADDDLIGAVATAMTGLRNTSAPS